MWYGRNTADDDDVHSVYTDFSRAFDKVSHKLLLHKMERQFGIQNNVLLWFSSYLSNRQQYVIFNGTESSWANVTSGDPQGSIFVPTLISLYVNDLPEVVQSLGCLLFADDSKLFKRVSSITDCLLLQRDIESLIQWCSDWKNSLNLDKCYFIKFSNKRKEVFDFIYTMFDSPISRVKEIKDLGVTFTSSFSFDKHINIITAKSFRFPGFLKRTMKPFKDPAVLFSLYNSYIRSRLEYCSLIWSPSSVAMSDKIERVQKKFLKFVSFQCNLDSSLSYDEKCQYFKIQTLSSRRKVSEVVFINKVYNNKIDCQSILQDLAFYVPSRRIRQRDLFYTRPRINIRKNSPLQRAMTCANSSNLDVFDGIVAFKRKARSYFSVP